jgi:hypothetical protein
MIQTADPGSMSRTCSRYSIGGRTIMSVMMPSVRSLAPCKDRIQRRCNQMCRIRVVTTWQTTPGTLLHMGAA